MNVIILLAALHLTPVYAIKLQEHVAAVTGANKQEDPTLRQWLNTDSYHVGMAPCFTNTLITHMSILNLLEREGLNKISSISGSSEAGTVAAIWASRTDNKQSLSHVFGSKSSDRNCSSNTCTPTEKFYYDYLNLPVLNDYEALFAVANETQVKKYGEDFMKPFTNNPTHKESRLSWIRSQWIMQEFEVKKDFSETHIPVVISSLDVKIDKEGDEVKNISKKEILMNRGNLQLAVTATASPPGNTRPVAVSKTHRVVDGYFGDDHGLQGYDAIPADTRSSRIVNIVLLDDFIQAQPMNWTVLSNHRDIKEVLTIEVASGNPYYLTHAVEMKRKGLPYVTYKHIVDALYDQITAAMDSPLHFVARNDSSIRECTLRVELSQNFPEVDFVNTIPAKIEGFIWSLIRLTLGNEFQHMDSVEIIEAIDATNLLDDPKLQTGALNYGKAVRQVLSGIQLAPPPPPENSSFSNFVGLSIIGLIIYCFWGRKSQEKSMKDSA